MSFPNLFKGKPDEKGTNVFDITLLFPKATTDLKEMKDAINKEILAKWPDAKSRPKLALPLRDGDVDKPHVPGYAGMYFITFRKRHTAPGVIRGDRTPINEQDANGCYAGCYAIVSYKAYAYSNEKKKGVSLSLYNVMKTRDGEPFSGASIEASDDFEGYTAPKVSATASAEGLLD